MAEPAAAVRRRIRVLRIIARMNVGGPAQQITGLLAGLDQERFDHHLAIGAPEAAEEDWVSLRAPWLEDDERITRVPGLRRELRPADDLRAYRQLRSLIRRLRPDVVHTHTAKAGLLGRAAALREGVPAIVHTFHGHLLQGFLGPARTAGVRVAERRLAARTDLLLSVGSQVRDELLAAGIGEPDQYVVVPPGVQPPATHERAAARAALGLGPDVAVVAFVGRLTTEKRPDRFLAVADEVARTHPHTVFLVAGGATPQDLARLQAHTGRVDVRWLGWVGDVGQVYAACDLVLLTSDTEGMPVTLIEAGMSGRPCVATDVGSVAEVVLDGSTGRVVPTDPGALAAAVRELLDAPDLARRQGAAAREHTRESFSMERLVATTEEVYEWLAGR